MAVRRRCSLSLRSCSVCWADARAAWVDVVLDAQDGLVDQRFAVGGAEGNVAVAAGERVKERIAQRIFGEQVLVAAAEGSQVRGDGAGGEAAIMQEVIAIVGEVGAVPELPGGIQPGDEFAQAVAVVAVGVRLQEALVGGGWGERLALERSGHGASICGWGRGAGSVVEADELEGGGGVAEMFK